MWGDNGTTSEEEDTWKETDLQCRNDSYRSASFITVLPLYFWVSASLQQPTSRYVFGNLHGPSKFHLVRHKHLYSRNTKASRIQEREDIKSTRAQAFVSLTTKSIRETCTGKETASSEKQTHRGLQYQRNTYNFLACSKDLWWPKWKRS